MPSPVSPLSFGKLVQCSISKPTGVSINKFTRVGGGWDVVKCVYANIEVERYWPLKIQYTAILLDSRLCPNTV